MATKIADAYVVLRASAERLAADMNVGRAAVIQGMSEIAASVSDVFRSVGNSIGGPIGSAIEYLGTLANRVSGVVRGTLAAGFGVAGAAAKGIADTLQTVIPAAARIAVGAIGAIVAGPAALISVFTTLGSAIVDVFKTAMSVVGSLISGLVTAISHVITSVIQTALDIVGGAMTKSAEMIAGFAARLGGAILGPAMSAFKAGLTDFEHWTTVAIEAESRTVRLGAIIRGTGAVAGWTADQMAGMARNLSNAWGMTIGQITEMQAQLSRFTNIRGDTFVQAMNAARQMSAIKGGDIVGWAERLGRALEGPEHAMRLLREAGIDLTPAEHALINLAIKTGELGKAQDFILNKLSRFGDVAGDMLNTVQGRVQRLGATWDNFGVQIGNAIKPIANVVLQFLQPLLEGFVGRLGGYVDGIAGDVQSIVNRASAWIEENKDQIAAWGSMAADILKDIYDGTVNLLGGAANFVRDALNNMTGGALDSADSIAGGITDALTAVRVAINSLPEIWAVVTSRLRLIWFDLTDYLKSVFDILLDKVKAAFDALLDYLGDRIKQFGKDILAGPWYDTGTGEFGWGERGQKALGTFAGAPGSKEDLAQKERDAQRKALEDQRKAAEDALRKRFQDARGEAYLIVRRNDEDIGRPTPADRDKEPAEMKFSMVSLADMWKKAQEQLSHNKMMSLTEGIKVATEKGAGHLANIDNNLKNIKAPEPVPGMAAP